MYILVNYSKKESVDFAHIGASKARELTGNPVAAAITTWYLLENRGDRIAFVSDYDDKAVWDEVVSYPDVTDKVVEALIQVGVLEDRGMAWVDESNNRAYIRALWNIWMPQITAGRQQGR